MQTENTEKTEEVVKDLRNMDDWHPVYSKRISYISSQKEWQELWDKAKTADELVGLLFRGLKIPLTDEEFYKQVSFYLEVAYGRHNDRYLCSGISSWTSFGKITISQLSQKVCLDAWKFLCQDFFKDQDKGKGEEPSWFYQLSFNHRIVDKIIWFFMEKDNCSFSSGFLGHDDKVVIDFLTKLAEYTWSSISYDHRRDLKQYLFTKRAQMLMIFWNIKKLDILFEKWHYVTEEDLNVLKELALIAEPWETEPKYKTVDEAMIGFSYQAAVAYAILNTRIKEKARQDKIKKAERQIEEANQDLKTLKA
ncbi:hypothetical protein KKE74_03260 [Patescibacteria group bacterium]|nr:hypothetical protein [Patescibacteria group bacterium]